MNAYFALLSAQFRMLLQYRAAAYAGVATQIFWGLIKMAALTAFFKISRSAHPINLSQTIAYIWICQALFHLEPLRPDLEVRAMIREGHVSYELLKPIELFGLWLARAVAFRTAPTAIRAPFILTLALVMGWLPAPHGFVEGVMALLSLGLAIFIAAGITCIITISMLWTVSPDGLAQVLAAITWSFSGLIVPLPLMPDWLQPVMFFLPFRGIFDTPIRIYLGHYTSNAAYFALMHQVIWVGILALLGRQLLKTGMRRLTIAGG